MSPFRSQAQRKKFYATPKLRKFISEFEADTPKRLPKRVKKVKRLKVKRKK